METEFASIEHEIHVDAAPEIVFDVVSRAEHLAQWWPDRAQIETKVGANGHIEFAQADGSAPKRVPMTIVEVEPPRRFSFRWDYAAGEQPDEGNSLLVVFELEPVGAGTRIRMTETGFREQGWEAAVLERNYLDHVSGWNYFIPRLATYVGNLAVSS